MTSLHVCTFSGASSLPLLVAQEMRIFERAGLDVELIQATSSDALMTGLIDGTYEIVHAAPDNFVAWRDRTGSEILAWVGGTSGPLALVVDPSITSLEQVAGRSVGVDAPTSGFVSAFRQTMRLAGVPESAIRLEVVGATNLRAQALRDGRIDATVLTLPWSAALERDGFRVLADVRSGAPRLQGSSAGSLRGWLEAEADTADAYLRSIIAALTWLQGAENHEATRALLRQRYGIEDDLAETVRAAFVDPLLGWPPSALIDPAGMEAVCRLRAENGNTPSAAPATYMTLEPYRRVLGFGLLDR
jgi:NitT/TauT family transport system substrate-binding protein